MKKISNKFTIALLLASALTACNTTSSGIGVDTTTGAKNLAELDAKQTTYNGQGVITEVTTDGEYTSTNTPTTTVKTSNANFTIKKNDKGGYDLTSNNTKYLPEGLDDNSFSGLVKKLTFNDFTSQHSNIIFGAHQKDDKTVEIATAVYGIKPSQLPAKKATYIGKATPGFFLVSDIKLDLDFETSKLTGKLDNFKEGTSSGPGNFQIKSISGDLNLSNGKIAADKISADLTGKILDKTTTGNLNGGIYGTNGEEVAGTISTTVDGKEQITGGFIAKR